MNIPFYTPLLSSSQVQHRRTESNRLTWNAEIPRRFTTRFPTEPNRLYRRAELSSLHLKSDYLTSNCISPWTWLDNLGSCVYAALPGARDDSTNNIIVLWSRVKQHPSFHLLKYESGNPACEKDCLVSTRTPPGLANFALLHRLHHTDTKSDYSFASEDIHGTRTISPHRWR
ncbi:hypothetical protein ARMSODRAFT_948051 [Armillaria solidipes]|uniref:Uncharacterized protein n=1 Tax=Armillaria solidipes TaxID=1076256 RepID=A0A2H3CLU0_9AGAR|nr:hypothetical protein ARMSODRAFT_948051 [Armillaria solidipes]